jgi:hypothetical protein
MALLSATQGTPERVWSLLNILAANGGEMDRKALTTWLSPPFRTAGGISAESTTAPGQTIQAANGLGLIDSSDKNTIKLLVTDLPSDHSGFADLVHDRLVELNEDEADAVLLEVFAWQVVQTEQQGSTQWIDDWTAEQFAAEADAAITPPDWKGERRFNSTKRTPWRRWMDVVGLNVALPSGHSYPCVTARIDRHLKVRYPKGSDEVPADRFLAAIGKDLPYLDGGKLFNRYAARSKLQPQRRTVSRIVSNALRDLAEDKAISFALHGDASDNYSLSSDQFSRFQSFAGVVVHGDR